MGLGGFAFALLGCDTVVTDTAEVISLLQRNYENNLSPAALRGDLISIHVLTLSVANPCCLLTSCIDPCSGLITRAMLQLVENCSMQDKQVPVWLVV